MRCRLSCKDLSIKIYSHKLSRKGLGCKLANINGHGDGKIKLNFLLTTLLAIFIHIVMNAPAPAISTVSLKEIGTPLRFAREHEMAVAGIHKAPYAIIFILQILSSSSFF